jgi:hypothetical protein
VVIIIAPYTDACAVIHARTSPTFQQVTLSDNLIGLGNVPAATLRHSVGALKGSGAGWSGRLGLLTSCDSRIKPLAGKSSKSKKRVMPFVGGLLDAIGVLGLLGLCDISGYLLSEGPIFPSYAIAWNR